MQPQPPTSGYGPYAPAQQTMPPGPYGPPPMTAPYRPMSRKQMGAFVTMAANLCIGLGAIILAFTLGSLTVSGVAYSPSTITFSVGSGSFVAGLILVGFGIIVRGFGGFLTTYYE